MKAPCKDCEKRELGCHSKCEEYQAFDKYNKARNEANIKERESLCYTYDERVKTKRRTRRR
jgi:hypothetical protein